MTGDLELGDLEAPFQPKPFYDFVYQCEGLKCRGAGVWNVVTMELLFSGG